MASDGLKGSEPIAPRFMEVTDGLDEVLKEIHADSPRATAIVAGTFVQDRLIEVIKSRLVQNDNTFRELFGPGRAIGDFSTQIDLGLLLRIYTAVAQKELHTIRRIRNDFAHRMTAKTFDEQRTSALCANLKLWEAVKIVIDATNVRSGGEFNVTIGHYDGELNENIFYVINANPENLSARKRYITACLFYVSAFDIIKHQSPQLSHPFC